MQVASAVVTDRKRPKPTTLRRDFLNDAQDLFTAESAVTWPSTRWQADPVGFCREVLGIDLWAKQVELLESIRDNRNTTCRSGHKCGKTTAIAAAALWFYASFTQARVFCTAVKAAQIDDAIWVEVKRLFRMSKAPLREKDEPRSAVIPLDGVLNDNAETGLTNDDGRQVWGLTARASEGLAGLSSPNMLILADEASGIPDKFFVVLGSSLASSGGTVRKCYISNPTRTEGEFYRSHTVNKGLFKAIHISSEDTPNARGEATIPGLAGPEWISEMRIEYGVDSHTYRVRVKGDFVHDKDGKIVSLNLIALAQAAWDSAANEGFVQLGIDPAGDGVLGDEAAIGLRRGNRIKTVPAWRGASEDDIVAHAIGMLRAELRAGDSTPRIAVDAGGGIGTRIVGKLRAHLEQFPGEFELLAVRADEKMWGSPEYHLVRDALWGTLQKWIKAGGAIPEDPKLAADLNAPVFTSDANRRLVATSKKDLRKLLGRSTDRGDAACLSVWKYESVVIDEVGSSETTGVVAATRRAAVDDDDAGNLDAYAGAAMWQGAR